MTGAPRSPLTPSQTVGPFFAVALPWADGPDVVPAGTPGAVWLQGRVLDGAGNAVPDALVETWQADPDGAFAEPGEDRSPGTGTAAGFRRFGRCPTDATGRWAVRTLKPGPVPGPGGTLQAPHVDLSIFARGLLDRVVTRLYFPDDEAANRADPVLATVEEARRATLVAAATDDGYTLDIRLQGPDETVFFAI